MDPPTGGYAVLSGDINIRKNMPDNCYHVVVMKSPISGDGSELESVEIIAGYADGGNRSGGRGPVSWDPDRWSLAWWNDLNPTLAAPAA